MLNNLKIGVRLGVGFAIVLLLLLVLAGVGVSRVSQLQNEVTDLVKDKNLKTKNNCSYYCPK